MQTTKRRNSTVKKLIIGLIVSIILLACLLYLYHNHWKELYIVNNIPTSLTGVGIIIIISLTMCTILVSGGFLLNIYFPGQTTSQKQILNLSDNFANVAIKDFDNFPLAKLISKDDISCIAKLSEDGKVIYSFNLKAKLYQTEDYEMILKYFDV